MMKTNNKAGLNYLIPKVTLLQESGLGTSEFAGRTAYQSFDKSENQQIKELNNLLNMDDIDDLVINNNIKKIHKTDNSKLLDSLAWVFHHHSVIEMCNLTYSIRGISRANLVEISRHRIGISLTVKSTRYTMQPIINAFLAEKTCNDNTYPSDWFFEAINSLNVFITTDKEYNRLQIIDMYNKLSYQYDSIGRDEFLGNTIVKEAKEWLTTAEEDRDTIFNYLQDSKTKRNSGDTLKHIVNDNWATDMVINFNLRSLKHFLDLRLNNAAWFQIRELSKQIVKATPEKYLSLILKDHRTS